MKKTSKSLILFSLAMALLSVTVLSACKMNITDNKFLTRPDVEIYGNSIVLHGSYVNSNTEYINVYRQDVTESKDSEIFRIGVIFPKGFNKENQTFSFYDENIYYGKKYRYYVRFVEKEGEKNRTDWSEEIQNTSDSLHTTADGSYGYSVGDGAYIYNPTTFTLTTTASFTPTSLIANYSTNYKPALIFKANDVIQTYEIEDLQSISLKELLPQSFYFADISLLGIVGQQKVYAEAKEGEEPELKYIIWTPLTAIKVKNSTGNELKTFRIEPQYGESGFDYSIDSDNEKTN